MMIMDIGKVHVLLLMSTLIKIMSKYCCQELIVLEEVVLSYE